MRLGHPTEIFIPQILMFDAVEKTKREKEDKSKKKTFRLKWGHLTEIFIREHGFLFLMHSTKEGQNHTK